MPHRCIKCGKIHPEGSDTLLKGCECGNKYFFFFKSEDMKIQEEFSSLSNQERLEIEHEVEELIPLIDDKPVILDIESVRIDKPGKFEIDLVSLFKRKPVIYRAGEGKYFIDLNSTFQLLNRRK
jgi:predicted  nucleic acid-binding Zn-ribbon protein